MKHKISCKTFVDFRKYSGPEPGKIQNVGSSLKFTPTQDDVEELPGIFDRDGALGNDNFKLLQFHFHWGSSNDRGSEHTFDGTRYVKYKMLKNFVFRCPSNAWSL